MSDFDSRRAPALRTLPLWIFLAFACISLQPAMAERVVIVGIDGGSWNVIDPLLEAGELPTLASLVDRGVTAELETVEPVISPVVWTSIATGRRPAAHGIEHFLSTRFELTVPTIFERLASRGHRVGLYDYLVTWPPPSLEDGFVIPSWLRRDEAVTPPDLWDRAGLAPYANSYDGLRDRDDYRDNARRELVLKPPRFNRLLELFDLELAAVTFYCVDALSHRFWRESFPDDFPDAKPEAVREASVQDVVRGTDRALAEITRELAPEDVILVASDHGFQANPDGSVVWPTYIHEILAHADLVPERDGFTIMHDFAGLVVRIHPGPFAEREATLERLRELVGSAHASDGERLYGVDVVDAIDRPPAARRTLLSRLRQLVVRWILRLRFGVELDQPAHAFLIARPRADVLERIWPDDIVRIGGRSIPVSELFQRDAFSGKHHPIGIFVAAGGPIEHRAPRDRVSVLDVAPLVAYLVAGEIPDDLEGAVPQRWIDAGHLAAHPPKRVAAPVRALPDLGNRDAAIGDDAEIIERLRRLGYVD
jgi:hypothetical protein